METSQKLENSSKERSGEYSSKTGWSGRSSSVKRCMVFEILLLCVVMVIIWTSLALPILFFYLPSVSPPTPSSELIQ